MNYPNPRHLRAFVALVETGTFSAAAEVVHVGQPALSQAIAKLEELVGVRLIERTTRSVRLTPPGEEFLVEARRVLEANERMMQRGADWTRLQRGRVHLFSIPSVAHRLLPSLVRRFSVLHPNIDVSVHDHPDRVLRERLERGDGDLAIVTHGQSASTRVALPFLRDRFRVLLPSDHPLAAQADVDAAQLASERLILLRRGALYRSYMDMAIGRLTLAHLPIEVDQTNTLTGMVEAGLGISLLPSLSSPRPSLRSVTTRPLKRPEVFRLVAFVQPPERELMPAVQAFVRAALRSLAEDVGELPEGCDLLPVSEQRVKRFIAGEPIALA